MNFCECEDIEFCYKFRSIYFYGKNIIIKWFVEILEIVRRGVRRKWT